MSSWGSFPKWWIGAELLPELEATSEETGKNIAALKIYLGLAMHADYESRVLQVTYDDLEKTTGLSRPMIKRGLDALVRIGVIAITATRPATYKLVEDPNSKLFAQIPISLLKTALRDLPNRGASALAALKLYLVLCHLRNFDGFSPVTVSHLRLQELTGVRPNALRQGLDHLVNHRLIHLQQEASDESHKGRPVNRYILLGIVDRRREKTFAVTPSSVGKSAAT